MQPYAGTYKFCPALAHPGVSQSVTSETQLLRRAAGYLRVSAAALWAKLSCWWEGSCPSHLLASIAPTHVRSAAPVMGSITIMTGSSDRR